MTPRDFIEKWRDARDEHAVAQSHFNDLCRLLGVEDLQTADPERSRLTFEQGARKAGGGSGWADVWRRGCFGWEYKSRGPEGDAVNAMLSAIGHNCRLLLAWFRQLLLRLVLDMSRRLFAMLPLLKRQEGVRPGHPQHPAGSRAEGFINVGHVVSNRLCG